MKAGQQSVRPRLSDPLPLAVLPMEGIEVHEGETAEITAPESEDQMVTFVVPLPSGRNAIVGLPAGCLPQEALYVVSKVNELAEAAYRAGPQGPVAPRRPKLWTPG